MTAADFRENILQLIEEHVDSTRTLEDYLLALLQNMQPYKDARPTYKDIATMLHDSYTSEPATYSDTWKELPWFTTTPNSEEYHREIRTFECQERQLKIRIAGIRGLRLDGTLKKDPKRLWLNGADDFRGSRWYNFEVNSFLERGTVHFETMDEDDEDYEAIEDWNDFGSIISDGVSYE